MKITNTHVYFWGGIFSNFYNCEMTYNGKLFHSSEQLFMYLKALHFEDYEIADEILYNAFTPKEAKNLGRKVSNFNNEEWENVRESIMMEALRCKFDCNPELKKLLLRHKDQIFVEASPYDKIWGVGLTEYDSRILDEEKWEGLNLLGKCLNKIVSEIK